MSTAHYIHTVRGSTLSCVKLTATLIWDVSVDALETLYLPAPIQVQSTRRIMQLINPFRAGNEGYKWYNLDKGTQQWHFRFL